MTRFPLIVSKARVTMKSREGQLNCIWAFTNKLYKIILSPSRHATQVLLSPLRNLGLVARGTKLWGDGDWSIV